MNHKKLQVWLPFFLSVAMVTGMFLGYKLRGNMPATGNMFSQPGVSPMREVMELIRNRYVDDVNPDSLGQAAIESMLTQLDPHSVYIPASDLSDVNDDLNGRFEGIGVEFNIFDDTVHVLTVLKDGPSDKAGLRAGDRFLRVGDSVVAGRKIGNDGIRNLLRGPGGSKVAVTMLRDGSEKTFTITRGYIPLSSLDAAYMLTATTGYIRLNKFSENTYEDFMKNLEELQKKGMKEMVLDLRDNGGGILEEAVEMADEFIGGDRRIVYTEGSHTPRKEYTCRRNGLFETGKLVLLMNEGSASASEVLAGALQDWDRATIIGRRSFGKGLVQEQYNLSDGSALRLTVARYYTPLGRSIQKSYANGIDKYHDEIMDRFQDGKLTRQDSIPQDSGKVYRTAGGKKVFGGGGISPDIFVPIDTSLRDTVLTPLYTRNTIGRFAYRHYVANRSAFDKFDSPEAFNREYRVDDAVLSELMDFAKRDSVVTGPMDGPTRERLRLRMKALLGRQQWRSEGYYEVMNTGDRMIEKALAELSQKP
jgi:carboxyl-terminal processing protease